MVVVVVVVLRNAAKMPLLLLPAEDGQ